MVKHVNPSLSEETKQTMVGIEPKNKKNLVAIKSALNKKISTAIDLSDKLNTTLQKVVILQGKISSKDTTAAIKKKIDKHLNNANKQNYDVRQKLRDAQHNVDKIDLSSSSPKKRP